MDGVNLTQAIITLAGAVGSTVVINTLLTRWILRRAEKSEKVAQDLRDQRIVELTKARDNLKETVAQLEAQVCELAKLRALVDVLRERIDKLEAQLAQAEKAMIERDEKIKALEAEMERLSDAKAQLEKLVSELKAENERLTIENAAYYKALQAVGAERAAHHDNTREQKAEQETTE